MVRKVPEQGKIVIVEGLAVPMSSDLIRCPTNVVDQIATDLKKASQQANELVEGFDQLADSESRLLNDLLGFGHHCITLFVIKNDFVQLFKPLFWICSSMPPIYG